MPQSIYRLDITPVLAGDEGIERADAFVKRIERPVEPGDPAVWHVTLENFENHAAAVRAFERELDDVDPKWSGIVSVH